MNLECLTLINLPVADREQNWRIVVRTRGNLEGPRRSADQPSATVTVVLYLQGYGINAGIRGARCPVNSHAAIRRQLGESGAGRQAGCQECQVVLVKVTGTHCKGQRLADNRDLVADEFQSRRHARSYNGENELGLGQLDRRCPAVTVVCRGQGGDHIVAAIVCRRRKAEQPGAIMVIDKRCKSIRRIEIARIDVELIAGRGRHDGRDEMYGVAIGIECGNRNFQNRFVIDGAIFQRGKVRRTIDVTDEDRHVDRGALAGIDGRRLCPSP